jgi:hypothetical protein
VTLALTHSASINANYKSEPCKLLFLTVRCRATQHSHRTLDNLRIRKEEFTAFLRRGFEGRDRIAVLFLLRRVTTRVAQSGADEMVCCLSAFGGKADVRGVASTPR